MKNKLINDKFLVYFEESLVKFSAHSEHFPDFVVKGTVWQDLRGGQKWYQSIGLPLTLIDMAFKAPSKAWHGG
jgi:hypothetical protein